ncbi:MAG: ABC transporter permease [Lachnospiraceae bacterium]|nr:ABC transporter permease [Lachnospiraceae bacterium]
MKILRLSLFNLRKNKREAAAIVFLTMITVFLLGTALTGILDIGKVFEECFSATGSREYFMEFRESSYRSLYRDILEEDFGIKDNEKFNVLFGLNINTLRKDGDKVAYHFLFVTEESERKAENFVIAKSMQEDQISGLAHPVWISSGVALNGGFEPGDAFTMVIGGRDYPFVVAGVYESGLSNNSGYGYKLVISERDYELLRGIMDEYVCLAFDAGKDFDTAQYTELCEERSSENLILAMRTESKWDEKANESVFCQLLMGFAIIMAVITMAASIFLIRHKISNDIEDQMQQIGVLEALGYRSAEISLSYILEYVMTAGAGAILGGVTAYIFSPVMDSFIGNLMGRIIHRNPEWLKIPLIAAAVVLVTTLFALLKAGQIRKYPPVIAFRKGIRTHHFGKNILPLTKAGKNINVTLAFKSFFKNIRTNIGTGLCIVLAGTALMYSTGGLHFFLQGTDAIISLMGMEIADERIVLLDGVDAYAFADEIKDFPEVRKTLVTYEAEYLTVEGFDTSATVIVYDDLSNTENIFLSEGRYPEEDNEVAISLKRSADRDLHVGDSITLEGSGTRKSLIITGIIPELSNSRYNIYMSEKAYLTCVPNARPDTVEVFLEKGAERSEFEKKVTEKFGASAKDMAENAEASGDLEQRIRSVADEKMATLISHYGVSDIDYSIVIGDKLISGRSSGFVIREMSSFMDLSKVQIEPVADMFLLFCGGGAIFVTVVVAAILAIIAASNVRRQRKELGIMKSMGYSSKDLMKQLALSMLPATVTASVIAAVLGATVYKAFWYYCFGIANDPNAAVLAITVVVLVIFCYIVTYLSAGRIRQVSVTELMTE